MKEQSKWVNLEKLWKISPIIRNLFSLVYSKLMSEPLELEPINQGINVKSLTNAKCSRNPSKDFKMAKIDNFQAFCGRGILHMQDTHSHRPYFLKEWKSYLSLMKSTDMKRKPTIHSRSSAVHLQKTKPDENTHCFDCNNLLSYGTCSETLENSSVKTYDTSQS